MKYRYTQGATLIEMLVIMVMVGLLTSVVSLNLFRSQQHASLSTIKDTIVSDIRAQQMKAMSGTTKTAGVYIDYSIRFEQDRYILYPGTVYTSNNPDNTIVPLDPIIRFSTIRFPNSTVQFSRLSGDIRSYVSGNDYVDVQNIQTSEQYRITINARGVPFIQ